MFKCDSLWCCWTTLLHYVAMGLWAVRWPVAVYAAVYAVGAAVFLLTLRIKSVDGQLRVDHTSWAYMLAHPLYYGGHDIDRRTSTSICALYARMLNMLLFVWPELLVYFAGATVVGSAVGLVMASSVAYPSLRSAGFIRFYPLLRLRLNKAESIAFPMGVITVPLAVLALAGWNIVKVLHALKVLAWGVGCLAPVLVAIGVGVTVVLMLRSPEPNAAHAAVEFGKARKEKFCKMVRLG